MTADLHELPPARAKTSPLLSIEAEQGVLGAMLVNNEVLAQLAPILQIDHFSEDLHRRIYLVAVELYEQKKPVSVWTLKTYLGDEEIAPGLTPQVYLARLVSNALPPIQAPEMAREIRDLAQRRSLIAIGEALAAGVRFAVPSATALSLAEKTLGDLQRIAETVTETETRRDAGKSAAAAVERVRAIRAGEKKDAGVSTGLPDLDRAVGGGFQPGTLWIIAGRPRMGKSVLGTGFARKVASRGARELADGRPGFGAQFFSLELPEEQIVARLLSDVAYNARRPITFGDILRGDLDEEGLWALEEAQQRLAALPLVLDVAPSLTVPEIAARVRAERARMARANTRLAVVFIDYLKFIRPSDRYHGSRVYEVGETSGALKQLAKSENVCVVLLAQVNRSVDKSDRKDKTPNLSDLRDSGDLEADADVVVFIDRESVRVKQSAEFKSGDAETTDRFLDLQHKADLIVAKTRSGSECAMSIWFDAGASTFSAHARDGA